jgi:DNA-binding IclR family transcriptional regulator
MALVEQTQRRAQRVQRYAAPALDKGLDILELLARESQGLTQKQIADRIHRSASEIFRMLACLERREFIRRTRPGDAYLLTPRLFELAHRHPPTRLLLDAAMPVMRELSRAARQSCHMGVLHGHDVLMVAQVDSPERVGFSVRLDARFEVLLSTTGAVLLAHVAQDVREQLLDELLKSSAEREPMQRRLDMIRRRGYERTRSRTIRGIIDLSYPIFDHTGTARAGLTVPVLAPRHNKLPLERIQAQLSEAASAISRAIGGGAGARSGARPGSGAGSGTRERT